MAENQAPGVVFSLEKIYVKDMSYEAPNTPHVFLEKNAPEVNVQIGIEHRALNKDDGVFEVVLTVTATATLQDKTVFLSEAKQAGIFRLQGIPEQELVKLLEISCPNILLPFAREVVNETVTKGGFPQLLINPINFEALFLQKQEAAEQQAPKH